MPWGFATFWLERCMQNLPYHVISILQGLLSYFERDRCCAAVSGDIGAKGHKTLHEMLPLQFQVHYIL